MIRGALLAYAVMAALWMAVLCAGMLLAAPGADRQANVLLGSLARFRARADATNPKLVILVVVLGIEWPLTLLLAVACEHAARRERKVQRG